MRILNRKIDSCDYCYIHERDKSRKKVSQCRYCKKYFCEKHLNPKVPSLPTFKSTGPEAELLIKEYHREDAHPCLPYLPYWERKVQKEKDAWGKTSDKLTGKARKYEERGIGYVYIPKKEDKYIEIKDIEKEIKKPFKEIKENKIKKFVANLKDKFVYWLKKREHYGYDYSRRFNYIFKLVLGLIISLVALIIIYSNIQKLNDINLWIIKLGSVLLLISLFFSIKYVWKVIKEIMNWIERQRNWLKYLIIIIFIILLWQVFVNRTTVLNPIFNYYNKTNFSIFFPLDIKNFTWKDEASFTYGNNKQITIPTSIKATIDKSKVESRIYELVNSERNRNGVSSLILNNYLSELAKEHSQRMIDEDFFEHSNYNLGENIGEVPIYADVIWCGYTYTEDSIAECFVSGWISSSGHHMNMIDWSYFSTGIGVACDNSKCRATEVFS